MVNPSSQKLNPLAQHLIAWTLYWLIWPARYLPYYPNYIGLIIADFFTTLPYVPLVYLNLYRLVPRYLLQGRYFVYLAFLILSLLVTAFISRWNYWYLYNYVFKDTTSIGFFLSPAGGVVIFLDIVVLTVFSLMLYLLGEWQVKQRYTKELENRNLEIELNVLRQQLNPHFLFNALNSIYVMMDRSVDKSREMLLHLSDLLSYQLYDARRGRVSLAKEVEQLENFINLERIRHGSLASITICIEVESRGRQIAPMLLMPVAENAFKHSASSEPYWISLELHTRGNQLVFSVKNSVRPIVPINQKGGIGLSNVRRRLELIYPDRHQLHIEKKDGVFSVKLNVQLDGAPVPDHR